jgi:hypothetical protein
LQTIFQPIQTVPTVSLEVVPKVKQKKKLSNTKLRQEVELTITQAKHEAMSQNACTKVSL